MVVVDLVVDLMAGAEVDGADTIVDEVVVDLVVDHADGGVDDGTACGM